jgi:DNA-binding response OmpR family regulator
MQHVNPKLDAEISRAPKILIVEDEKQLSSHLEKISTQFGYQIQKIENYKDLEVLIFSLTSNIDVIILDRLLHGKDSSPLIPKIKSLMPEVRIIVLSAINSPAEKATLLNNGADDYVSKPFDANELMARIKVMLRKADSTINFSNLILNVHQRNIKVGDQEENLPNKEFSLLHAMIKHPRKVFTKTEFYETVWGMSSDVDSNVIETTINKIRKRLEDLGVKAKIRNRRNVGYWIEE